MINIFNRTLASKIVLLASSIAILSSLSIGLSVYLFSKQEIINTAIEGIESESRLIALRFSNAYDDIKDDLLVLSKTPPIQGIIRSKINKGLDPIESSTYLLWQQRLAEIFKSFIMARKSYRQIRFVGIEHEGKEIVRVNCIDDKTQVVPESMLQKKGKSRYFRNSLRLTQGEYYFSDITLNREHGKIDPTHTPMLRAIYPVFSKTTNRMFGLIIINVDYEAFLREVMSEIKPNKTVYIFNNAGDYLKYNNLKKSTAFYFHQKSRDFSNSLINKFNKSPKDKETLYTKNTVSYFHKLYPIKGNFNSYLGIVLSVPKSVFFNQENKILQNILYLTIAITLLVMVITSWVMKKVLLPLTRLTKSISNSAVDTPLNLSIEKSDEVGKLALALCNKTNALLRYQARLKAVIENTIDGIITFNHKGIITQINPSGEKLINYNNDDIIGKNIGILLSSTNNRNNNQKAIDFFLSKNTGQINRVNIHKKNGHCFVADLSISKYHLENEDHYSMIIRDKSAKLKYERRLYQLANQDPLTNLPNRKNLIEKVQLSLERAKRTNTLMALFFLDLDNFKQINDNFGHYSGDEVLVSVSKQFQTITRSTDYIARIGGDEFAVIITSIDNINTIRQAARRYVSSMANRFIIGEGFKVSVTLSLGVSIYPTTAKSPTELLKNADIAMYQAKNKGKNQFVFFNEKLNSRVQRQNSIEIGLRDAISNGELILYYQPQLSILTKKIVGVEALVRWKNKHLGNPLPDEFIPIAERNGLIIPLGNWLMEKAFQDYRTMVIENGFSGDLSINISAVQLLHDRFSEDFSNLYKKYSIGKGNIIVEITETSLLKNILKSKKILKNLNRQGVLFALDDFGTGYSSMKYLKDLPIHFLKIDKSFVGEISKFSSNRVIVEAIISLAKSLDLTTVAEGVEHIDEFNFLKNKGCDQIQGYYFAKPMPIENLVQFLSNAK